MSARHIYTKTFSYVISAFRPVRLTVNLIVKKNENLSYILITIKLIESPQVLSLQNLMTKILLRYIINLY